MQQQGSKIENVETLTLHNHDELQSIERRIKELEEQKNAAEERERALIAAAAASVATTPQTSNLTSPNNKNQEDKLQQIFDALKPQGGGTNTTKGRRNNNPNSVNYKRDVPNDLVDGQRSSRRYPNCMSYCFKCGFDLAPTHGSMNNGRCPYVEPNETFKKEATMENTMGGSQRNMHLYHQAVGRPFTVPKKKGE